MDDGRFLQGWPDKEPPRSFDEPVYALVPACAACGCREIVQALAPIGQREQPVFLRCCQCGRERDDLDFYEEEGA